MPAHDATEISSLPVLPGCSAADMAALIESGTTRALASGDTLIEQGSVGDKAYLIVDGQFDVSSAVGDSNESVRLTTIESGTLVGATALISAPGTRRNATLTATSDATVIAIDRASFEELTAWNDELAMRLESERDHQLAQQQLLRTPLYSLLIGDRPITELGQRFEVDEPLMTEGEAADGIYLIVSGAVTIFKTIDDLEIRLGDVLAGGVVGELGVVDGKPRAATVRAAVATEAVFVGRDQLASREPGTDAYFATLRRLYELPDRGLVSQNFGEFEGAVAVRTTYDLPDDCQVVCHSIADQDLHHAVAMKNGKVREVADTWLWGNDDGTIEIGVDGARVPVEARLQGPNDDFRLLYRCLFAGLPLPPETGETLQKSGRFELDRRRLSRLDDDEVCTCMGVTEVQINRVTRTYAPDLEQIQDMLGCGTVCGSCVDDVEDLLGG